MQLKHLKIIVLIINILNFYGFAIFKMQSFIYKWINIEEKLRKKCLNLYFACKLM